MPVRRFKAADPDTAWGMLVPGEKPIVRLRQRRELARQIRVLGDCPDCRHLGAEHVGYGNDSDGECGECAYELMSAQGVAYLEGSCAGNNDGGRIPFCVAYDLAVDRIDAMRAYGDIASFMPPSP